MSGSACAHIFRELTPFALRRLGGLVAFNGMLFFVLVISFTLSLENLLISIKALAELNKLCEALVIRVKPLDDELFLTLLPE